MSPALLATSWPRRNTQRDVLHMGPQLGVDQPFDDLRRGEALIVLTFFSLGGRRDHGLWKRCILDKSCG